MARPELAHNASACLISEPAEGIPLHRLRQLALLRPAQAAAIGIGVLAGLRALHEAGCTHGDLVAANVWIERSGRVRLTGWGRAQLRGDYPAATLREDDLIAAATLITQLGVASAPAELDRLDAALHAALAAADPRATALDKATAELAALVRAATGRPAPRPPARPAASPAEPVERPGGLGKRIVGGLFRHTWRWIVALLVLATALGLEFGFLHGRLTQDLHQLLGNATPTTTAAPPSRRPAPPVPLVAPAAAGVVSGVWLRPVNPCAAGTICAVTVEIQVQPHAVAFQVNWQFQLVSRCSGREQRLPGGTFAVPAQDTTVTAIRDILVPPGGPFAVLAVTTQPARTASAPLLVPTAGFC